MNGDRISVEQRAAVHAALADPARLQVVDLLGLGDRSPSELQGRLSMPSNLLAHHLTQLEHAGLIERSRSEADRRRTYIRLIPAALHDLAAAGPAAEAARVVFVCTANSARSQLAAALWSKASRVPATSAGTHPAERIDAGAIAAAERHGLSLRAKAPRDLLGVQQPGDLVVTVCDAAHEELGDVGVHWSVPDPVREGSDAAFDAAFDQIASRIGELAPRVSA